VLLGWIAKDPGEIEEALARSEAIRSEDELAAEVLHLVNGQAVGVTAWLE
jgi:hypothetical protein